MLRSTPSARPTPRQGEAPLHRVPRHRLPWPQSEKPRGVGQSPTSFALHITARHVTNGNIFGPLAETISAYQGARLGWNLRYLRNLRMTSGLLAVSYT